MKKLLKNRKYNSGKRPSEHRIGKTSFLKNNQGAIPSNVLTISNTVSTDPYLKYCREHKIPYHPARMPLKLASYFIAFLTEPNDIVLDPFAGSNVTGYTAEYLGRHWISIEKEEKYAISSEARFLNNQFKN
jgi:site-specific DNA-methyltransferase (cytosine-N4-specific)